MKSEDKPSYEDVQIERKPKSIYDRDVDFEKVMQLSARDKHRLFPNDFAPDGQPYGDF